MKNKILSLAATILFAASVNTAFAGASWIGNSAINVNGTWYYCGTNLNWCSAAFQPTDESNINLGEISALHIGGQCQVSDNGNDWGQSAGTINMMYYKIDNGAEKVIGLTYYDFGQGQYGKGNMRFQSGGANFVGTSINISGFEVGSIHTISVRFQCDDKQDPGNNNYYVARFKIKAPISVASANEFTNVPAGSDVKLSGLTLYKDGNWNTLCLPFNLSQGDVEMSELANSDIRELTRSELSENGTLTLTFSSVKSITAGQPYIIKWDSGDDIKDPIFTGVTITAPQPGSVGGDFSFKGTFSPKTINGQNYLYLGAENTLYYPSSDVTIGAFRAYFKLNLPSGQPAKSFVLNFDDETTGIKQINNTASATDTYFTLDGRRLNYKPATAGLYIINGKKVLIK
jgi:hypothetical protein